MSTWNQTCPLWKPSLQGRFVPSEFRVFGANLSNAIRLQKPLACGNQTGINRNGYETAQNFSMNAIELKNIAKSFGSHTVISQLDLAIAQGEFMVLVGPSGCGKSTLLRLLAGLEAPTNGKIVLFGRDATNLPPRKRDLAMVFQNYALYPHMTVEANLGFALKLDRRPKAEIRVRVLEIAQMLRLEDHLIKKPSQLSGGQKQRVAIGRALARKPHLILFDEPLSNLDIQLRVKMRTEIAQLHRQLGATIVYVTHDQVEAMTLASRVAVLHNGRLEQVGTPKEVYHYPATDFVASFFGSPPMNLVHARRETLDLLAEQNVPIPTAAHKIGFRPEDTSLTRGPVVRQNEDMQKGPVIVEGRVSLVELLGSKALVHVTTSSWESVTLEVPENKVVPLDTRVSVHAPAAQLTFFGERGERLTSQP